MNLINSKLYVKETCKIGQGNDCCAYLVMGTEGFECVKGTTLAYQVELYLASGEWTSQGDNCAGLSDVLKHASLR